MKWRFYPGEDSSVLCVFYAGWGMDEHPFEHCAGQRDTLIVWDYTDLSPLDFPFDNRPVALVAWSMGVWAATQTFPTDHLISATAFNGTPYPIDDTRGIPPAVFDATLAAHSANGLARFQRRMCGGAAAMNLFLQRAPRRTVEDLGTELAALGSAIRTRPPRPFPWTCAIGCTGDKIFPLAAQRMAFPDLIERPGAHWEPTLLELLLKGRPV